MLLAGLYWLTLIICAGYALSRGAAPERTGAIIMIAGSIASVVATSALGFIHVELGIFGVDLVVLAALLTLALRVDRLWPLWMTGFQFVGVTTHAAMMLRPEVVPRAYALAQGFWGYPMLVALAVGTLTLANRDPAKGC